MTRYNSRPDSSNIISSIILIGIIYLFYSNLQWLNTWINNHTSWIKNGIYLILAISFIFPFTFSKSSINQEYIPKQNIPQLMKNMILSDQHNKCYRCNSILHNNQYYIDLIIPIYKGGSQQSSNYYALCPTCHKSKQLENIINNI